MDDLISRQAAIDEFYIQADDDGWWTGTAQDMEELLKGLPSVEPEIIRCKDCEHASRCYRDIILWSWSGGFVQQPVDYCSYGEREGANE